MLWITAFLEGLGVWEGWLAATVVEAPVEEGRRERRERKEEEGGEGKESEGEMGGRREGGERKRDDHLGNSGPHYSIHKIITIALSYTEVCCRLYCYECAANGNK